MSTIHCLATSDRSLVVDVKSGVPELLWFGGLLPEDLRTITSLAERPVPNAQLDSIGTATLLPAEVDGWPGQPGIDGRRDDGSGWSPRWSFVSCDVEDNKIVATGQDTVANLTASSTITLEPSGVATFTVEIRNDGDDAFVIDRVATTLALPDYVDELQVPEGRWVHEFHEVHLPWRTGAVELVNRRGRTSADKPPWIFAGTAGFSNQQGQVWGAHLGWSGNSAVRAEKLTDGRRVLQLGEMLLGDEVRLEGGESYRSPVTYLSYSSEGLNGSSQRFHQFLRNREQHLAIDKPRPVHMNTWEAVYFNHDLDTLKDLADKAAEVGAERYVLDDGWFHGRRNDEAGLGDWWVDEIVWPDGLEPLIDHVRSLGMEFGIWVEPEMVNPNSELFGQHPEWVLGVPGYEPLNGRNQLVLDLTNDEAWNYLFEHLNSLLANHEVGYVKWDMNRDLTQPASGVRAVSHHQTHAVYRLIDALRAEHPDVEIESCSSGGSRADYGILERTDRIWTSDSNDALERQRIQRGFLRFFPPEIMGAHVGPDTSHTSGRQHNLGFRATTAFFGHLGIEWNLLDASADQRSQLAKVISLHKAHRHLLHAGTVWQVDTADPGLAVMGVAAQDRSEALFSVAQLTISVNGSPERVRIPGLDTDGSYNVEAMLLADTKLGLAVSQPSWPTAGLTDVPGRLLAEFGLQIPALDPESAILVKLTRS